MNCFQMLLLNSTCAATAGDDVRRHGAQGKALQVDPIKPTLKLPGTKRLKLNCDILLSTYAFKFNLRRHTKVGKNV